MLPRFFRLVNFQNCYVYLLRWNDTEHMGIICHLKDTFVLYCCDLHRICCTLLLRM